MRARSSSRRIRAQVVDGARLVVDGEIANVIAVLGHDLRERAAQRLGVRGPRALHGAAAFDELLVPRVERRRRSPLGQQRVALPQHAPVAADRLEVARIDAGDAAVEKAPPLFRRAAQDVQPRRRVGEDAHRIHVRRQRHALAVDHQRAAPASRRSPGRPRASCRRRSGAAAPETKTLGDPKLEQAPDARRAKRFRRRQEVDRLEKVRLPLPVAADNEFCGVRPGDESRRRVLMINGERVTLPAYVQRDERLRLLVRAAGDHARRARRAAPLPRPRHRQHRRDLSRERSAGTVRVLKQRNALLADAATHVVARRLGRRARRPPRRRASRPGRRTPRR